MTPLSYLGLLLLVICLQSRSVWPTPVEPASEEKPAVSVSKDKVFYSQEANPQEWEEWFSGKKDYIKQTTTLFRQAAGIARDQGSTMQKDVSSQKISGIIRELQRLVPPDELSVYHDKIVRSCQIMQSIIDAYNNGSSRYAAYTINSMTLAMDAVKSLRQLYAQHGASQENMDGLVDLVINSFFKGVAQKEGHD
jgi:hypothetical protein